MNEPQRFTASADGRLDAAMRQAYRRDGFLILQNFVAAGACESLIERADALVDDFQPGDVATVFSARHQTHKAAEYFRSSGDKIRFFFEPDAFDPKGRLRQTKALSINKIGHALHDLDAVFQGFSRTPKLRALAASLGGQQPLLLQSMYIFKQARIGGEVDCHQDSSFLHTEPLSCVGFWFALQDASIENGCLYAIPGRHPLKQRFHYRGDELVMETWDDSPWPQHRAVPLEAPQGTLIVLDGSLPHFSAPNRSSRSRHAYTLHVIDAACRYSPDNWLQRAANMPLQGF